MTANDHLLRDLAPIPAKAWEEIDSEARRGSRRCSPPAGSSTGRGRTGGTRLCGGAHRRLAAPPAGSRRTDVQTAAPGAAASRDQGAVHRGPAEIDDIQRGDRRRARRPRAGPRRSPRARRTGPSSTAGPPPASTVSSRRPRTSGRAGRRTARPTRHRRAGRGHRCAARDRRPVRARDQPGALHPASSRPPSTAATCWWTTWRGSSAAGGLVAGPRRRARAEPARRRLPCWRSARTLGRLPRPRRRVGAPLPGGDADVPGDRAGRRRRPHLSRVPPAWRRWTTCAGRPPPAPAARCTSRRRGRYSGRGRRAPG